MIFGNLWWWFSLAVANNWFINVFDHVSISKEWETSSSNVELICKEFVETKLCEKPHLHCLLHLLGPHFSNTHFPNGMTFIDANTDVLSEIKQYRFHIIICKSTTITQHMAFRSMQNKSNGNHSDAAPRHT
eukprot:530596_1